jgi:hypothetical protein
MTKTNIKNNAGSGSPFTISSGEFNAMADAYFKTLGQMPGCHSAKKAFMAVNSRRFH